MQMIKNKEIKDADLIDVSLQQRSLQNRVLIAEIFESNYCSSIMNFAIKHIYKHDTSNFKINIKYTHSVM